MSDFKNKVCSLSAKEIILAMVNGLKNKHVEIDISTFGKVIDSDPKKDSPVFYGCVATNCIIEINDGVIHNLNGTRKERYLSVHPNDIQGRFVMYFETAIDALRKGDIYEYNIRALGNGFAYIKNYQSFNLPVLTENYTEEELSVYIELANLQ